MRIFRWTTTILLVIILFSGRGISVSGQTTMQQVLDTATIENQLNYINDRTRIYDNFRAIREDIFQKMKTNAIDSVTAGKDRINELDLQLNSRSDEITSLNANLQSIKNDRDQAIKNRDSLSFLGIQMNKTLYNSVIWIIILGLIALLVILFLLLKGTRSSMIRMRDELEETKEEFEVYKKNSREKYEKLVVTHHNEIIKFKRS